MKNLLLSILLIFTASLAAANPYKISQQLTYIAADYENAVVRGEIIDFNEYQEMQEFIANVQRGLAIDHRNQTPLTSQALLLEKSHELAQLIDEKGSPALIREKALKLNLALIQVYQLQHLPTQQPDETLGKKLYQFHGCSGCHGIQGYGDGPQSSHLTPTPTNFRDATHMQHLDLFALYNTITQGVDGTAMQPYQDTLTAHERWSLATFLKTMTQTPNDNWSLIESKLAESLAKAKVSEYEKAYELAISAYLDGFEPIEPLLDTHSRTLRTQIEQALLTFRQQLQSKASMEILSETYLTIQSNLEEAKTRLKTESLSEMSVFLSAFLILLREGLEMILVIGMILTVLSRTGKTQGLKYVHIGWVSALFAGGILWLCSHFLLTLSGISRELTEGFTALLAASILLYIGLWMHRQTTNLRWKQFLASTLKQSLGQSSLWGIAGLSFLAVFREMFEIILFYEALLTKALNPSVIFSGAAVAVVCLLALVFAILRAGIQLPLQMFFKVSSVLIFTLALIFIGQGLHALEEAGFLPNWPLSVPTIGLIGLYPNLYSAGAQISCALIIIGIYSKRKITN